MSRDLHDIDDLFRSALETNEETPSAAVKESLFASLDKSDAESYKKGFIGWKRTAILLLFLLAGFVLYESGLLKNPVDYFTGKIITKKADTLTPAEEAINERTDGKTVTDKTIPGKQQDDNSEVQKNQPFTRQVISTDGNDKPISNFSKPSNTDDTYEGTLEKNLPGEKRNRAAPAENIRLARIYTRRSNSMQPLKIPADIRSHLETGTTKNIHQKRIHHFKPYWMLTGLLTFDRVNYKLDSDQPNAINNIKHREVREPSFSVGILATRQLKERWGLQTGIVYSHTAIGISPQKMYAFQDPAGDIAYKYITSSGYAYFKPGIGAPPAFGDSINTTEAKHNLQSLSIPVTVKYAIGKNKLLFIPGAGFEANFITKAKLEIEIEDASNRETVFINKLKGTKSFYWSLVADAELRYLVNKQLSFNIRPVFRYAISPITENNVVETFPYSFGAGLGITYRF